MTDRLPEARVREAEAVARFIRRYPAVIWAGRPGEDRPVDLSPLAESFLALREQVTATEKHDCDYWRSEGIGCADCHDVASALTETASLRSQVTALRALAEEAVAWLDSYYHEGRVAAQSRYRARLAAIGGGEG